MRCLLFTLLMTAGLAATGCSGGAGRGMAVPADADATLSTRRLRQTLRRTTTAEADSFAVVRMQRAGLTPIFGARFRLASGLVAGFVPGRHPGRAGELVVVGAEAGTPGGAALLETARLLAARAAFTTRPERTVLLVLWPRGAPDGLASVLRAPVWPAEAIASAWAVTGDSAATARALGVRGLRGGLVSVVPANADALAEAERLARAVLATVDAEANRAPPSSGASVPPPDSTGTRL